MSDSQDQERRTPRASQTPEAPRPPEAPRADAEREESLQAEALAQALTSSGGEERERLARIVDLLPCYVALIDQERRIIFHNRAFETFFGAPGGKRCFELMRGRRDACPQCLPPARIAGKGAMVMEWAHSVSGNAFRVHVFPFDDHSGVPCTLEVGFNITASLRMQQALDLSEQSYRAITDNLSIGIALLDGKLRIKAGNIRLSQWFEEGFRKDRRICGLLRCGTEHIRADADPDYTCPDCPFQASFQDGLGHEKELTVTVRAGNERVMRLVTCPVKPRSGRGARTQVRAVILMLEDITNRLRVTQQLQRARKLEAMGTLAGGIAHEINQPLSALHLYAGGLQMLLEKERALPQETTRERLALIMAEADKIRSIISHMRTLVMQEEPAPLEGVSLADAVDNVLAIMKHQFDTRGIRTLVDVPASLPPVRSNDVQIEQVLVNLLANAKHAIDCKSRDSGLQTPTVLIRAFLLPESGRVRLEMADNGQGLPKGGERIFDPFFTTKERHEGMGLGLSIVHGLVSLWGGEISARPRHPELGGAAFYIDLLPVDAARPAGKTAGRARQGTGQGAGQGTGQGTGQGAAQETGRETGRDAASRAHAAAAPPGAPPAGGGAKSPAPRPGVRVRKKTRVIGAGKTPSGEKDQ